MPTINVDTEKCKGCILCIDVCPHELIRQERSINRQGYQYVILDDPEGRCTGCTLCALMCPDICIEVFK